MTEPNVAVNWSPDAKASAKKLDRSGRSSFSKIFLLLYKVQRLRSFCLKLCLKLESGPMISQTIRELLQREHDVVVGRYSYGPLLTPGVLPPGSRVGAYCSVASGLVVFRRNHPTDRPMMHPYFYNASLGLLEKDAIHVDADNPLHIGNDVWIGQGVKILPGCRNIGNGAVIAAGAVVSKDVEAYSVVGGVPAKQMAMRFSDNEIALVEKTEWWTRTISELIDILADGPPLTPVELAHQIGQNGQSVAD